MQTLTKIANVLVAILIAVLFATVVAACFRACTWFDFSRVLP